ncbi:MAG: ExeM/NucH family extracellular endonuclease [Actinomycetota bacterium]
MATAAVVVPTVSTVEAVDGPALTVFISEIHYDNDGTDVGEAIEVFGPAGTDLTGWQIVRYNGNGGGEYGSDTLSGTIPDLDGTSGVVVLNYPSNGLQNGSPDGVALIDAGGTVVQFLSYEGTFAATDGPAAGLTSTDIGVEEAGDTAIGDSLQLLGTGTTNGDFTWQAPAPSSFGAINGSGGGGGGGGGGGPVDGVAITEIHYDNAGTDVGEAVEITGPAGTDLAGWTVVRYNGSSGAVYGTDPLGGVIPDLDGTSGVVVVDYPSNGLQNGSPDGLALVAPDDTVVEFLSYEGSFTASDGPAAGLTSTDIGVSETSSTPVGESLQLIDDVWTGPAEDTFGSLNDGTGGGGGAPFLSEIHYDNVGTDVGEAVEITGPAGTDLTGWTVVRYNGNNGGQYGTDALVGVIPDLDGTSGVVVLDYPENGLQNGAPDGVALVAPSGAVVEFLSYEGSFTASDGPAAGLTSTDIGVAETSSTPVGESLQLIDGVWTGPAPASFGSLNSDGGGGGGPGNCPDAPEVTNIGAVQGAGAATPCAGEEVIVEGVVVGDFEGPSPALRGFYVQEEDADADNDPTTSDAIFVFNADDDSVSLGDTVRVTGTAAEFADQTQLSFSTIEVLASGDGSSTPGVTPSTFTLPVATADFLERFEGMLVTVDQELFVTEYFQLGRFGQVVVSSGGRLDQPTAVAEPGPEANAVQAANDLNRLIVDDTLNEQNPEPIIYGGNGQPLMADNPLRGGDVTVSPTGVLTYTWAGNSASGDAFRLRPTVEPIEFETRNPRPTSVPSVGGTLTVASFNVLNYFLTLDDGSDACGPIGSKDGCRGADDAQEFERQRVKLLAALAKIDADVVGLIELENTELADGTVVEPLADIVAGLNDLAGSEEWAFVDAGAIGTDVIKVGFIYRVDAVTAIGDPAILDSSVDPRFDDSRNRPALAQTFTEDHSGEVMTVIVNHFKSKGCSGSTGLDVAQGDGQGCFNASRTSAAEALVDWAAASPTGIADDDVLVIGDLNAYDNEDPIDVFIDAGYVDLADRFEDDPYSFVFSGQWGYLDYALASPSLVSQVTGAAEYHINADEVPVLDYNTNFQSPTQIDDLFAPDEFRTSDHDPVLVGLKLDAAPGGRVTALPGILWPANGRLRNVVVFGNQGFRVLDTEIVSVTSNQDDSGLARNDRPNDIRLVNDRLVRLRAEAFGGTRTYEILVQVNGDGQIRFETEKVRVFQRRFHFFW